MAAKLYCVLGTIISENFVQVAESTDDPRKELYMYEGQDKAKNTVPKNALVAEGAECRCLKPLIEAIQALLCRTCTESYDKAMGDDLQKLYLVQVIEYDHSAKQRRGAHQDASINTGHIIVGYTSVSSHRFMKMKMPMTSHEIEVFIVSVCTNRSCTRSLSAYLYRALPFVVAGAAS
jgi:hypothetical protein